MPGKNQCRKFDTDVLNESGIPHWNSILCVDEFAAVRSRKSLDACRMNNELLKAEPTATGHSFAMGYIAVVTVWSTY